MLYKEVYNSELIGQDSLSGLISEFLGYDINKDCQKMLAYRLSNIRQQIEYDKEWRTPTLDELKDGDEVEIQTSYGWSTGKWPDVLSHDTHVNLFGGSTIESKFNYASLRIKNNKNV